MSPTKFSTVAASSARTENRSVAGIVVRNAQLFIARRLPGGAMGGKWEFPGGKVDGDEGDSEALVREFREELEVDIVVGGILASTHFINNQKVVALNAYEVFFNSTDFRLTEHSEWRWASFAELMDLDFADSDRRLFEDIRKNLGL